MELFFKRAVFMQKVALQVTGNHGMAKSLIAEGEGSDKIWLCGSGFHV